MQVGIIRYIIAIIVRHVNPLLLDKHYIYYIMGCLYLFMFQVGPGVVFLQFNHSFLGRGVILQTVTPVEPLLQCVSHTMFYQSHVPPVVPKFFLKAESIQVQVT